MKRVLLMLLLIPLICMALPMPFNHGVASCVTAVRPTSGGIPGQIFFNSLSFSGGWPAGWNTTVYAEIVLGAGLSPITLNFYSDIGESTLIATAIATYSNVGNSANILATGTSALIGTVTLGADTSNQSYGPVTITYLCQ